MPWASPELIALLGIIDERAEEGRLQSFGIAPQAADEVPRNEVRGLFREKHIAVDIIEDLDRDILEPLAAHQHDDRHFEAAPAHQVDESRRLSLEALLAPIDHHTTDRRIGLDRELRILDPPCANHLIAELLDGRDDFLQPQAFEIDRIESRSAYEEGETPVEVHAWLRDDGWRTTAASGRARPARLPSKPFSHQEHYGWMTRVAGCRRTVAGRK